MSIDRRRLVWDMNEAALTTGTNAEDRIGWVQVGLTEEVVGPAITSLAQTYGWGESASIRVSFHTR